MQNKPKSLTPDEIALIEALAAKRLSPKITEAVKALYSVDIPRFLEDLKEMYQDKLELARLSELHEIEPTYHSNMVTRLFGVIDALSVIHAEIKKGGVNNG